MLLQTATTIYVIGLSLTAAIAFLPNRSSGWPQRGIRLPLALICLGWPLTVPLAAMLADEDEAECPEWTIRSCGA